MKLFAKCMGLLVLCVALIPVGIVAMLLALPNWLLSRFVVDPIGREVEKVLAEIEREKLK